MLAIMIVLRPNLSIMSAAQQAEDAAGQGRDPEHAARPRGGRDRRSAARASVLSRTAAADDREHQKFVGVEQKADRGDGENKPAGDGTEGRATELRMTQEGFSRRQLQIDN